MDNNDIPFAFNNFYRKVLLELGVFELQYDKFGQAVDLPMNNTDTVKMRRYERLPKASTPLAPGVNPVGSVPTITDVTAQVRQYGDFIPVYDVVTDLNPDTKIG